MTFGSYNPNSYFFDKNYENENPIINDDNYLEVNEMIEQKSYSDYQLNKEDFNNDLTDNTENLSNDNSGRENQNEFFDVNDKSNNDEFTTQNAQILQDFDGVYNTDNTVDEGTISNNDENAQTTYEKSVDEFKNSFSVIIIL